MIVLLYPVDDALSRGEIHRPPARYRISDRATLGGVFALTLDGYLGFAENGELAFGIRLLVHLPHLRRWSDRIKNAAIGDARFGVIGNQLITIGGNSLARVRGPAGLG